MVVQNFVYFLCAILFALRLHFGFCRPVRFIVSGVNASNRIFGLSFEKLSATVKFNSVMWACAAPTKGKI